MGRPGKIVEIERLAEVARSLRPEKKVIHCHGVFDLLHVGHIRHLKEAKKLGDVLVVTVSPDRYVNKGPHRPVFSEELRAEAVAALDSVDFVAINKWPTAVEAIELLKPHIYVKGSDYRQTEKDRTGAIAREERAVNSVGGHIVFTDEITFSSTSLINRHLPVFPKEVSHYLMALSAKYSFEAILEYLERARSLKVLIVGEAIIDEYQYCETIGKSGKEPILAARYLASEKFAGGILAVANQVAAFSDRVGVLTFLGTQDSQEEYIRGHLDDKVEKFFLYFDNAPTIVKRRFVEPYPFQKLFEVYVMGDNEGDGAKTEMLCAKLREVLPAYDVVIVVDYGHGMLGPAAVELLCEQARFLAINTQTNADNRGFNTVSKYHSAHYMCVSENEIRLDVRSRRRGIRDIVLEVARKLSCGHMLITRGQQGCLCYDDKEGFFEVPAFSSRIVDRVGAGDAVFSVTTLCVAQNAPMEVVGFIGNTVGAQAVATVGHRSRVEQVSLLKHIESLLK